MRHKIKLTGSLRQQTEGPSQSKGWEERGVQRGGDAGHPKERLYYKFQFKNMKIDMGRSQSYKGSGGQCRTYHPGKRFKDQQLFAFGKKKKVRGRNFS